MGTILFTHPSAELYGADKTLLQAVRAAVQGGWRAVVALPRRGVLADELEGAGATVEVGELGAAMRADLSPTRFPAFLMKARAGARFVSGLVERHGVDVVHTNTSVLVGAAWGAHRSRARHVWHVHEILESPTWANRTMRRVIRAWADLAIANSEATARAMFDPRMESMAVVHNGVEGPGPVKGTGRDELARRFGIPPDGPLVVVPGRINGWKGQKLVVEAVERARVALGHVQFVFAGDAPPGQEHFAEELGDAIARTGLGASMHRIGFTRELEGLMAAADLCVVPSTLPEPFGMVAIESMATGTPVLAAGHGGLVEIVEDGVNGALFIPGSPEDLSLQLQGLLGAPEELVALGTTARRTVAERFGVARYGAELLECYHRVAPVAAAPGSRAA